MSDKITIHLIGKEDVVVRELDEVDWKQPQYVNLSPTRREVYHFDGFDEKHIAIYLLKGEDEVEFPTPRS